jgi:hypothetical protein
MPPVPYNAESIEALRSRYARALEHVYDVAAIRDGAAIRPGEVAANVFDWSDGLRLIVSRERFEGGEVALHFSASFPRGCRLHRDVGKAVAEKGPAEALRYFLAEAVARFAELSGDARTPVLIGQSDEGIPHWNIEEQPS